MVNIEKITSTLAKLPDQALQRYAMMHKDDPYIVALAVSESNRRKDMRAAGQAQPMQQQPKVVDQAVAEMTPQQMPAMPEEQGIGALPVQMDFAEGGITGYAGGGEVERYQLGGDTMGGFTPDFAQLELMDSARSLQAQEVQRAKTLAELEQKAAFLASVGAPQAESARAQLEAFKSSGRVANPTAPTASNAAPVPTPVGSLSNRAMINQSEQVARRDANTYSAPPKATDAAPKIKAAPSAATAPAAPVASIEDRFLAAQKRLTDQANPYQAQEDALAAEQKKFAEDKLAAVTERNEKFKDAFKGREGRIEERAKELEKSKDTNTGLAFLEAGLAIMSTPGGLATAIGKGAREGTAKYAAGIERLRSAKDKLDDARDRMEELRLNRDEMSAKEEMEAKLGIQQTVISGKKDALASAKTLFGERSALSQAIVKETLNAEEKAKDRATQVQTAGAATAIALKPQADFIADWLAKPENKGKTFSDAYAAFKSVGASSERNDIAGLKAVRTALAKDLEDVMLDKASKERKRAEMDRIDQQILALSGVLAPSTKGGAQRTIDWNSIK